MSTFEDIKRELAENTESLNTFTKVRREGTQKVLFPLPPLPPPCCVREKQN